jgi:hypothetical protein
MQECPNSSAIKNVKVAMTTRRMKEYGSIRSNVWRTARRRWEGGNTGMGGFAEVFSKNWVG